MKRLRTGPSAISGMGVFADEDIAGGERVRLIDGDIVFRINRTKEDSLSNPDWIGIGQYRWIDPRGVLRFLNHSCEPNVGVVTPEADVVAVVAMRDIIAGEELTFDYSTTECDPLWEMSCTCGSVRCRRIIRSILTLPRARYEQYLPYVPVGFREVYEAEEVR